MISTGCRLQYHVFLAGRSVAHGVQSLTMPAHRFNSPPIIMTSVSVTGEPLIIEMPSHYIQQTLIYSLALIIVYKIHKIVVNV